MPSISRSKVIQGFLHLFGDPRYLEIGVAAGVTFHAVRAGRKVAVDPKFRFDVNEALGVQQSHASYHEMTSDAYFGAVVALTDRGGSVF